MKFTEFDLTKLEQRGGKNSDIFKTLEEFSKAKIRCAKIDEYHHKTAASCAQAFRSATRRYRMPHIKVTVRKDDVYLINTIF